MLMTRQEMQKRFEVGQAAIKAVIERYQIKPVMKEGRAYLFDAEVVKRHIKNLLYKIAFWVLSQVTEAYTIYQFEADFIDYIEPTLTLVRKSPMGSFEIMIPLEQQSIEELIQILEKIKEERKS